MHAIFVSLSSFFTTGDPGMGVGLKALPSSITVERSMLLEIALEGKVRKERTPETAKRQTTAKNLIFDYSISTACPANKDLLDDRIYRIRNNSSRLQ
jgi:hypothetical protein